LPVSVVIVHYKTLDLTRKALLALFASISLPEQVIVVDNNSEDGIDIMIKKEFPEVLIIVSKENLGFAKGNNLALRQCAKSKYVWLLNSDTETGKKTLFELCSFLDSHNKVGAVGPSLAYPDGSMQSPGGYFPSGCNVLRYLLPIGYLFPILWRQRLKDMALYPQILPPEGLELDYATGAALMVRQEVLKDVGLLPEDYFMYFEETDLCFRMKRKGWKVMALKTEPVMHVYGGSFKTKYDPRRLKIFLDSLKLFVHKNYIGLKKFIILSEVFIFGRFSVWLKGIKNKL